MGLPLSELQSRLADLLSEHDEYVNRALVLRGRALELEYIILNKVRRGGNGTVSVEENTSHESER